MPQRATRPVLASLSCVLLVLGGCLGTPPTRFYLLPTLTDVSAPAATGERALTIGVGPVTLPPYLDRPQIVTRASQAQLHVAEKHHGRLEHETNVAAECLDGVVGNGSTAIHNVATHRIVQAIQQPVLYL